MLTPHSPLHSTLPFWTYELTFGPSSEWKIGCLNQQSEHTEYLSPAVLVEKVLSGGRNVRLNVKFVHFVWKFSWCVESKRQKLGMHYACVWVRKLSCFDRCSNCPPQNISFSCVQLQPTVSFPCEHYLELLWTQYRNQANPTYWFHFYGVGVSLDRLTVDNVQFGTCSFRKLITGGIDKKKVPTNLITTRCRRFLSGRHPCYQLCRRSPPGSMSLHGAATEVAPMWSSSSDTV